MKTAKLTSAQWSIVLEALGDYREGNSDTGDPAQGRAAAMCERASQSLIAQGIARYAIARRQRK